MDYSQYIKDHTRFGNYTTGKKLYEGKHAEVFGIRNYEYYQNTQLEYLVYNYSVVLTNAFCDLIWSEEPEIDLEDKSSQEIVDNWINEDSVMVTLRECSECASHSGEAVTKFVLNR
jgi:hypothetical protein